VSRYRQAATAAVTVFKVLPDGQGETLRHKLFVKVCGVLVSDRATALKFWAMKRRQICWAHLVRKFVSFSQRDGPAGRIGEELLEYTTIVFDYWPMLRESRLSRAELIARMAPVRLQVEALLERAMAKNIKGLSGSCEDILEHQSSDGDPGIAQKRPNCRSESTLDNFRSGSDRRLKSLGFSTELVIKTPDPL